MCDSLDLEVMDYFSPEKANKGRAENKKPDRKPTRAKQKTRCQTAHRRPAKSLKRLSLVFFF